MQPHRTHRVLYTTLCGETRSTLDTFDGHVVQEQLLAGAAGEPDARGTEDREAAMLDSGLLRN